MMLHSQHLIGTYRDSEIKWPEFQSDHHYSSLSSLASHCIFCALISSSKTIQIIAPTSQVSIRIKQESIDEEHRTVTEIKLAYKY